jgi:hypothetical protein
MPRHQHTKQSCQSADTVPLSKQSTAAQHPTKKKKRRLHRVPHPMPPLVSDHIVLTMAQFRQLANLGERTARRMIRDGHGPILTQLTGRKLGVSYGNYKRWVESRTAKSSSAPSRT